ERVRVKWNQHERRTRSAPSPLWGRVGEGVVRMANGGAPSRPPPPAPLHKGEGSAPRARRHYASSTNEHALGAVAPASLRAFIPSPSATSRRGDEGAIGPAARASAWAKE